MYTSFYTAGGHAHKPSSRKHGNIPAVPTKDDLMMNSNATLQLNQRILGGEATVVAILSEQSFIMWHDGFRQEFMARKVP